MIVCKVCGGRICEQVACCSRCFTPHHFDCWSFWGQCSTYGCGNREHLYFDFKEKSEAEIVSEIGRNLALALKEVERIDETTSSPSSVSSRDADGVPPASSAVGSSHRASTSREQCAADLVDYKRRLFRTLHAHLQKISPERAHASELLIGTDDTDEVDSTGLPTLFVADDISLDEPTNVRLDLSEKRRLLHSLAEHSSTRPSAGLFRRVLDWLTRSFRRMRR